LVDEVDMFFDLIPCLLYHGSSLTADCFTQRIDLIEHLDDVTIAVLVCDFVFPSTEGKARGNWMIGCSADLFDQYKKLPVTAC
jgi:hypothetical protein